MIKNAPEMRTQGHYPLDYIIYAKKDIEYSIGMIIRSVMIRLKKLKSRAAETLLLT